MTLVVDTVARSMQTNSSTSVTIRSLTPSVSAEAAVHSADSPVLAPVAPSGAAGAVSPSLVAPLASSAPGAELAALLAAEAADPKVLEAEKLRVYHLALELHSLASTLVPTMNRVLRDQFERASLSVVLNIAEGAGRHSRRQKRYHYAVARGSATECAAISDILRLRRLASAMQCERLRGLATLAVRMLTKLDAALAAPSSTSAQRVAEVVA
jgi:four helix bundle protein